MITFFFFFFFDPLFANKPPHIALREASDKSPEEYYSEAFAQRLKAARQKHRPAQTQKDFAKEAGVAINSLCSYENAGNSEKKHLPSLSNALAIADTLGVSLDYLFARGEYTNQPTGASLGSLARILISLAQYEGLQLEEADTPALVVTQERLTEFFHEYLDYQKALNEQPNEKMQRMFDSWLNGKLNELDGITLKTPAKETSISPESPLPLE